MRIRQAIAEDSRAISEIHVESRRVAWRHLLDDAYLSGLNVEEEEHELSTGLASPNEGWRMFVADEGAALVGFVSFRIEPEDKELGYLGALFVAPDRFNQGVGTVLQQAASDELKAAGRSCGILVGARRGPSSGGVL